MKKLLCILTLIPLVVKTQIIKTSTISTSNIIGDHGIKWTEGLSWHELKELALKENKYIFLDCFATWCGPCKLMEKDVFSNEEVGRFINSKFISVRVQMDKTKNDNVYVQNWYNDAAEISKHYFLDMFPTYLFFSPTGKIVHKETGYQKVEKFIDLAQTALIPGKKWNDEYAEYELLIAAYKKGDIRYDRLPFMATIAKKLNDTVRKELIRLHENYVSALPAKERYTKENISFWATLNLKSDRKIVHFFYKDGKQIDQIMQKKGYAQAQVDKTIQNFIVSPYIDEQIKNPDAKSGISTLNTSTGTLVSNPTSYDEADWEQLYHLIKKDFNKTFAKRNLQLAKASWYEKHSNWYAYARINFEIFKTNPPNLQDLKESDNLNQVCWNTFLQIKDKKLINNAINWMEKLVQIHNASNFLDTYANLLYIMGRNEEALHWQEKAVSLNPSIKMHQKALSQMKKGEPTYGVKW